MGALAGAWGAPWVAARLGDVATLDPGRWTVIIPGRNERALTDLATTGVVDGSLRLAVQAFGRVDSVVPRVEGEVGAVEVELARGSAPLAVSLRSPTGEVFRPAEVAPGGWRARRDEAWRSYAEPGRVRIEVAGGQARVDGVVAGPARPGTLELSPVAEPALVRAIRVEDAAGATLVEERFGGGAPGIVGRLLGAVGGAVVGALGAVSGRSRTGPALVGAAIGVALPVLALLPSYGAWEALRGHLYLSGVTPGALRRTALAAAFLPLLVTALHATGILGLPDRGERRIPTPAILAGLAVVALLGVRGLAPVAWAGALPGLAFLVLPLWSARRAGLDEGRAVLRDLPALVAVAGLGWPAGLLPAVGWRLLGVWADVPTFLERSARGGVDALFVYLLCLPLAVETGLRATSVGEAWSPDTLAGASARAVGGEAAGFAPFWTASCGQAPRASVYLFGGSSAGGAYQFTGEPEAFFVAKLHGRLCGAGRAVQTLNFGNSGRDTWDIAQAAPGLFAAAAPAVVIVYAGVNDLLTKNTPLTRKQQAARLRAVEVNTGALTTLVGRSRLLTGVGLLLRPEEAAPELVEAVPLSDAEENLRAVAAATTAAGGRLLLVPEYVQPAMARPMAPYADLERRLAEELDGVEFVDVRSTLDALPPEEVLADRNHLSRSGGEVVAAALEPVVARLLDTP